MESSTHGRLGEEEVGSMPLPEDTLSPDSPNYPLEVMSLLRLSLADALEFTDTAAHPSVENFVFKNFPLV